MVAPDAARFTFDSAEYALAGRTWLETGRLATPFLHPASLRPLAGPPFPLLAGHPLVPALDAVAFALLGRTPDATLVPAAIAYAACVLLVVRLAFALGGSRLAALGAGAAFALSPWALHFACEGRTEMPFAALHTAALLLLWELPRAPRAVALGVLLGVAHLARPIVVPLLPAWALGFWFLAPRDRRAGLAARALAGFLPLASLTALYKWAATGSAFTDVAGTLLLTGISPEWAVARLNRMNPPPDAIAWVLGHPGAFAGKVLANLRSLLYGAWDAAGRLSPTLAALGTLLAIARPAVVGEGGTRAEPGHMEQSRAFALTLLAQFALLALLAAATVADPRMLFPLLPAGVALGFAMLARLAAALGARRRLALALACALVAAGAAVSLARGWRHAGADAAQRGFRETEWRDLGAAVAPLLPAKGLVASDEPPWLAWQTRRAVVSVPLEPEQLLAAEPRLRPAAVVLTNEWLVKRPLEERWREMLERDSPPAGFRFAGHVKSGRLEAAVFTRPPSP